jgi:CO/xanthine dehydrogenase Mo-binding subunit
MTRTRRSASTAGTAFATMAARFFARTLGNDGIELRNRNGAKDRGDITGIKYGGQRVVVECKEYGGEFRVGTWLAEAETERGNDDAGVAMVIAKRRGYSYANPGDQVVLMTLRDLVSLMTGERPQ